MRVAAFCLLAMLAGCGSVDVHKARTQIVGMNLADLMAGIGKPNEIQKLSNNEALLEYDRKGDSGSLFSLKVLTLTQVAFGKQGDCKALFGVLRDGTVTRANFSNTSFSFGGPYSDCDPLIKELVHNPDSTELPKGYDAFDILGLTNGPQNGQASAHTSK